MFRLIVFAVCSACLIYVSRASLRVPRSHGFYRFFAWEFILALILLNVDRWFHEPFSAHQIASWLLCFNRACDPRRLPAEGRREARQ
jgi:hypothetical protein